MLSTPITASRLLVDAEARQRYERECLKCFDADGDGLLELAEVAACIQRLFEHVGLKALPQHVLGKTFREYESSIASDAGITLPNFETLFKRALHFIARQGAGEHDMLDFESARDPGSAENLCAIDQWVHTVQFFSGLEYWHRFHTSQGGASIRSCSEPRWRRVCCSCGRLKGQYCWRYCGGWPRRSTGQWPSVTTSNSNLSLHSS